MNNAIEQIEVIEKELQYYKAQLDKVTGNLLSDQYTLTQALFDANQFDRGLKIILGLQQNFNINAPLSDFFKNALEQIKTRLSTHKVMILKVGEKGNLMPLLWLGYSTIDSDLTAKKRIKVLQDSFLQNVPICVHKDSVLSSFERAVSEHLGVSTFILIWLTNGSEVWGALLTARDYEQKMFTYQAYSQTEVKLINSIGGVISACIHQSLKQKEIDVERLRIARDMHDDIGAELSRITAACSRIQSSLNEEPELTRQLQYIQKTSMQVIDNIGNVIWALNPINNSLISLLGYIREFANDYLEANGLSLRFEAPELFVDSFIHNDKRIQLFRAVKESLHNIVKHAAATNIRITIAIEANLFSCSIADDGKGFVLNKKNTFGNGLRNMQQRMNEAGGEFTLTSKPGEGTLVQFITPL